MGCPLEVFDQDPPGHGVDDQVVGHEEEPPTPPLAQAPQHRAQEGRLGEAQAPLEPGRRLLQGAPAMALRRAPDIAAIHRFLGDLELAAGNREPAAAAYREALRLDPGG